MSITLAFPIYGGSLTPQSGVAGLDSEISLDGGAFADCINEATEIGSTGWYTLEIEDSEFDGATLVIVQVKTTAMGTMGFTFGLGDNSVIVAPFPGDGVVGVG